MLDVMPRLYGDRITDAESVELIARLRARGTKEAIAAANTVGKGPSRDATVATSLVARDAIALELREWDCLEETSPTLARLRDRLSTPRHDSRII
jgi:hypothetical protein